MEVYPRTTGDKMKTEITIKAVEDKVVGNVSEEELCKNCCLAGLDCSDIRKVLEENNLPACKNGYTYQIMEATT